MAASVAIMAVTLVPYVVHASRPVPGRVYTGLERYINDQVSYLMWTNQVRRGHLAVTNLFVQDLPERFAPNPLWALLGLVARRLPFPTVVLYHAARIVLGVAYLMALFCLLRALAPDRRTCWTAWLLSATGGGFAWLWWLKTGDTSLAGLRTSADYMPEAWTFSSLQYFPHFAASLLLMVGCLGHLAGAFRGRPKLALLAGLWLGILALVHTYTAVTILGIAGVLVVLWLLTGGAWRPVLIPCALMAAVSAPFFGWQAWEVARHETLRLWSATNQMPSPPVGSYVMGFGLVGVAAAVTLLRRVRSWVRRRPVAVEEVLVVAWVVATVALLFSGVSFERRCVEGLHIPLACLAATGLAGDLCRLSARARSVVLTAFLLLCVPTSVWYIARDLPNEDAYIPAGLVAAEATAFSLQGEQARVLCTGYLGRWLPMEGRVRVYLGHAQLTFNRDLRKATLRRFFAAETRDEERLRILRGTGCQMVLASREERGPLDASPDVWRCVAGDGLVGLYVPQEAR